MHILHLSKGRELWLPAVCALSWNTLGAVLLRQHCLVFVSEELLRGCQCTWPPQLGECCWNAALRAGEHGLEVECQGSMGFWIPNPTGYTERDDSKIFLVLEEIISWGATSFNILKQHLPFPIGLGCLCYICVTDRKVSSWKPILLQRSELLFITGKFNFKSDEIVLQSNLFYSGIFPLGSNILFFSGIQNLKHMACIKGKDVRCNEEENSVLW